MSTTVTVVPNIAQATVEAYRVADTKGKARIRRDLQAAQNRAIDNFDMQAAHDAKATLAACTSSTERTKVEVDYAAEVAQRIADLRAAADYLASGTYLPKGISADMVAQSATDLAEVDFDEVEVSDQAVAIATAKVTRSAERNSIEAVFERAFDGEEEGTFLTCQEIANRGALGEYRPSPGAVAARLFPRKGDVTLPEAYMPDTNEKGVKGATLTEA